LNRPDICPACGADVPPNAKACPECGSCEETGWSEEGRYAGLNLPDPDFDYEDFVREEFGGKARRRFPVLWVAVASLIIVLVLLGKVLGLF